MDRQTDNQTYGYKNKQNKRQSTDTSTISPFKKMHRKKKKSIDINTTENKENANGKK